jgi:hypothetical protein
MPEQHLAPPAPETHATTYEEVLARPNLHSGMRPYLERLIDAENLPEPATKMQIVTNKLQSYAQTLEQTPADIARGRPSIDEVYDMFEDEDYTPEQVNAFISASLHAHRVENAAFEKIDGSPQSSNIASTAINTLVQALGQTRDIYFSKDKAASEDLRELLMAVDDPLQHEASLRFIRVLYKYDDVLDLLEPDNVALKDPTVRMLLEKDTTIEAILKTLQLEHDILWPDEASAEDCSVARRDWADRYLKLVVGLPEAVRDDFQFSAYSRTTDSETGLVDKDTLADTLQRITWSTDKLDKSDIEELRKNAGIVNLDYFEPQQLELMTNLLSMDEQTIKHLQEGDVTVVFTDASGDYNGAFSTNAETFATPSGRTLFFEIHGPRDLYKYMNFLHSAGIKPSTLVLGAHGADGKIKFNEGDAAFAFSAGIDGGEQSYATTLSKALPRLISEFMQDSRGIDDNPEAIGRRRVIIHSCCQAKPVEITRPRLPMHSKPKFDEELDWREIGKPPMVRTKESTAEAITRRANNPHLDVYAPSDVAALYENDADTGMRYERVINPGTKDEWREPMTTSHFFMDVYGNLIQQEVDEVLLRRAKENT